MSTLRVDLSHKLSTHRQVLGVFLTYKKGTKQGQVVSSCFIEFEEILGHRFDSS